MKVSEAIAEFLSYHVKHVFLVNGGANLHIVHAIAHQEGLTYVCPQGEQGASFAADAYARLKGFGCALATSGPGATNLVTGISASFFDSVPVLYITGQQSRSRMRGDSGCRQIGFQETPIIEIVRPITKYAVTVMDKGVLMAELQTAVTIAKMGRKGPVLVDIPDDLQREELDV